MREYFLNSDFDLTLRGSKSLLESSEATFIHEMTWHYIFSAGPEDSVVVHQAPPTDFLAYLTSKGVALPKITLSPAVNAPATFTPFGWNTFTEKLSILYHEVPLHPNLEVIKWANSRKFSQALEQSWSLADGEAWTQEKNGGIFESMDSLAAFLSTHHFAENGVSHPGWVAKGNHGHAGTANRHIAAGPLNAEDQKWLEVILEEHGAIALEPWHQRILDLAVNFQVESGGAISDLRGHELFNSREGTFLGVKLFPNRHPPEPWSEALETAAKRLGLALNQIGYFGPVSLDAYVWLSPSGPRLRSLVDINARHSMALPIHGIGRQFTDKILLWIWMKPRKIILPRNYSELETQLGLAAFNTSTRTGILPISPIWTQAQEVRGMEMGMEIGTSNSPKKIPPPNTAKRIGFLFSARSEAELDDLRKQFALRLGRR